MAKLLLLSSIGPRLPLVASVVAHAAIVVAAAGGHGSGTTRARLDEQTIDVEAVVLPPTLQEQLPVPEAHSHHDHPLTYTTHTHPYPLPPNHDDIPHDPSIDHRLAAAAPAVLAAAAPALPSFSIVLGSADLATGGTTSAGGGSGQGPGSPAPTSGPGAQGDDEPTVSVPARLVSNVRPEYPPAARSQGIEADVSLEIVVDSSGRVVESRVLRHAGYGFDESALRAIRTSRFTPAQHEGAAVRVRMDWTVSFRLE